MKKKKIFKTLGILNNFHNCWDRYYPSPELLEIDKICPQLRELEKNFSSIQEEAAIILQKRKGIPTYDQVDPNILSSKNNPGRWQVFMLKGWRYDYKENQQYCPKTTALINKIPNVYQAFFSILDPYKYIKKHRGEYKGYLRYHLGVNIPTNPSPYLLVNDLKVHWKEGKGFIFDDFQYHEAFNDNRKSRVVLIVDLVRKRPFIPNLVNYLFLKLAMRPFYFKRVCDPNASLNFDRAKDK